MDESTNDAHFDGKHQYDLASLREAQATLEKRDRLLDAVNTVAQILLSSDTDKFEDGLWRALDILGKTIDVDRVYIWKNRLDENGKLYCTQLYEWSPGVVSQQGSELTIDISYDESIPTWEIPLKAGKSVSGLVKNMTVEEQNQLSPQGIISLLVTPISIENKFWGFIGFDDCRKERVFSETEAGILRACGHMIISSIIRNEVTANLIVAKDEALSGTRAKSNFLANMSHEIRTPMNAILGMAELILREETTPIIIDHATTIKNACQNLLAIINDILDISKVESGKLEIAPVRYQLTSLLSDVIGIVKIRANNKKLFFAVNIDSTLPCELFGDEIRIRQILINILGNAIKFTEKGHILFSVKGVAEEDSLKLEFTIFDTGRGIRPEEIKNLFFAFKQMDTKKNRNIEGSGLGLTISKQLCEMMNGSIEIESEYGVGSTFKIILTQKIEDMRPIVSVKNPEQKNILVYETRSLYTDSISNALKSLRCRYQLCKNQSELYEFLNESHYDYIFVASLHYEKARALVKKKQLKVPIVLMLDDDECFFEKDAITISMPIHCLQIARVICDEAAGQDYGDGTMPDILSMAAPAARVLVVDDNLVNLKVAAGLLKSYEMQVETAISGYVAIEMMKNVVYDLVFMDHMMPGMDGIDTTVAIRNLGGEYFSTVPIIALTANAVSGVKEMFKAEGLDDYLAKPIEISKLNTILTTWIPSEKQKKRNVERGNIEICDFEIPGIDIQTGMRYANNSLEAYKEILSTFVFDGEKKMEAIQDCIGKDDIKLLTIHVHAMKSGAANIGSIELSCAAAELEFAGNNGDIMYIEQHIKPFIHLFSEVILNIKLYLDGDGGRKIVSYKPANEDFLREKIVEIEAHIENVEIEQIETAINQLFAYHWSNDVLQSLQKIKESISTFDYDALENSIKELKGKIY